MCLEVSAWHREDSFGAFHLLITNLSQKVETNLELILPFE